MPNKIIPQVVSLGALLIASFFLIDPLDIAMPDNVHMAMLAGVVVIAGVFTALVLSEGGGDERDEAHRAFAGRAAFFVGTLILLLGIIIQTLQHALDPWLVYVLVGMTIGKVGARFIAASTR